MEITSIYSLISTLFSGGLVGAVGGLASKWIEHKQELELEKLKLEQFKVKTSYDLAIAEKNNETLRLELDNALKLAGVEAASSFDHDSFEALKAGYENDKANYATGEIAKNSKWFIAVDFMRGITRPLLTWVLDITVLLLAVYLIYILKDSISSIGAATGLVLLMEIVKAILFLATTSTSYWYASRTVTKSS